MLRCPAEIPEPPHEGILVFEDFRGLAARDIVISEITPLDRLPAVAEGDGQRIVLGLEAEPLFDIRRRKIAHIGIVDDRARQVFCLIFSCGPHIEKSADCRCGRRSGKSDDETLPAFLFGRCGRLLRFDPFRDADGLDFGLRIIGGNTRNVRRCVFRTVFQIRHTYSSL